MKQKIQKLHKIDCFKEKAVASYYIDLEENYSKTGYGKDYL